MVRKGSSSDHAKCGPDVGGQGRQCRQQHFLRSGRRHRLGLRIRAIEDDHQSSGRGGTGRARQRGMGMARQKALNTRSVMHSSYTREQTRKQSTRRASRSCGPGKAKMSSALTESPQSTDVFPHDTHCGRSRQDGGSEPSAARPTNASTLRASSSPLREPTPGKQKMRSGPKVGMWD